MAFLWWGDFEPKVQWTLSLLVLGFWWACAAAIHARVVYPLQTLANLLEALREGDFSLRGRHASVDHALGQVMLEVNALSTTLHRQRLGAVEATTLMQTVMREIELAVFAFDDDEVLRLVNRAGEELLAQPAVRLLGRSAADLGLDQWLEGDPQLTSRRTFPGGVGRWGVRRRRFRLEGRIHHLLVVTDLSRALREEERQAWRRLIRVLGHEINNSLAPIKSTAETLRSLLARGSGRRQVAPERPARLDHNLSRGLGLISDRAESLSRFIAAYARLARLPEPDLGPVALDPWVRRVATLETRVPVELEPGPAVTLEADADQLEQLLINLLKNAAEANGEGPRREDGVVTLGWRLLPSPTGVPSPGVELWVRDQGPGLATSDNLFVPFFTTKPGGTGIGLVLCQQIAEAHGGLLTLANRPEGGCEARLRLPLPAA